MTPRGRSARPWGRFPLPPVNHSRISWGGQSVAATQREPPCGWGGRSTDVSQANLALALLCCVFSPLPLWW